MQLNKDFWMSLKGLFATLLLCVVAFFAGYAATWLFTSPNEAGDTAGLINGFFSALAFAGVIYAIFLQRHELELQRKGRSPILYLSVAANRIRQPMIPRRLRHFCAASSAKQSSRSQTSVRTPPLAVNSSPSSSTTPTTS